MQARVERAELVARGLVSSARAPARRVEAARGAPETRGSDCAVTAIMSEVN